MTRDKQRRREWVRWWVGYVAAAPLFKVADVGAAAERLGCRIVEWSERATDVATCSQHDRPMQECLDYGRAHIVPNPDGPKVCPCVLNGARPVAGGLCQACTNLGPGVPS